MVKNYTILIQKSILQIERLVFSYAQCAADRKAVDAWCLMAVRINSKVNRDIRKMIGMIIWEARELADYAVAESADAGVKRARIEISE